MPKKNSGETKAGGGNPKPKSAVETIAALIMSGALGDEAKQKAKEVLTGDSDFFSWWQRKSGESLASTDNVLKALGLLVGYEIYDHADPLKGSKVDNAVILLATLALGMLLVVPQSTELGAHFHNFETKVLLACHDLPEEDRKKILVWLRSLSHKQEGRIGTILLKIAGDEKNTGAFKTILADENMRDILRDLVGEEASPMTFEEGVEKAREVVKKHWPAVHKSLRTIDSNVGGVLEKINDNLERHWFFRSAKPKSKADRKCPWRKLWPKKGGE
ncbi:MAG: hypothetical protein NUV61_02540 [Candidatus Azambacteria bacterium]|nr:hypothetical protein [Candidatus Azambacteria bacterium]